MFISIAAVDKIIIYIGFKDVLPCIPMGICQKKPPPDNGGGFCSNLDKTL